MSEEKFIQINFILKSPKQKLLMYSNEMVSISTRVTLLFV